MRWLPEELKPNIVSLSLRPGGEEEVLGKKPLNFGKDKSKVVFIHSQRSGLHRKSDGINKKLLELICGFYKVSGYKINIKNHISLH